MDFELDTTEVRVLGALVEKDFTTPDQYPLSLNALVNACNQKSSRDPVMQLTDTDVVTALDSLLRKHLVRERNQAGSRVTKYGHRLSDSLGLRFSFSRNALGTLCVLMLRGPQTPGEIRARTGRLCEFDSLPAVEKALAELEGDEHGPYVQRLHRRPGAKEARYAHLLSGEVAEADHAPAPPSDYSSDAPGATPSAHQDLAALTERVELLELEVAELREQLSALRPHPTDEA